jgi:hypothetical protein
MHARTCCIPVDPSTKQHCTRARAHTHLLADAHTHTLTCSRTYLHAHAHVYEHATLCRAFPGSCRTSGTSSTIQPGWEARVQAEAQGSSTSLTTPTGSFRCLTRSTTATLTFFATGDTNTCAVSPLCRSCKGWFGCWHGTAFNVHAHACTHVTFRSVSVVR